MKTPLLLIESLPQAFRMIKQMNLSPEWDSDYRTAARQALRDILEERMNDRLERYLDEVGRSLADRRNGYYCRHLLTELGDIELRVPRSRKRSMLEVVRAYARRVGCVERMILACFVLGISTRKIAHALMPLLGEPVSPSVVSRVARLLDEAVQSFHRRPLARPYRFLLLTASCSSAEPAPGPSGASSWWCWASRPRAARRSSTSGSPMPSHRAPGSPFWPICTAGASRARGSR